jgi:hypothetical protein
MGTKQLVDLGKIEPYYRVALTTWGGSLQEWLTGNSGSSLYGLSNRFVVRYFSPRSGSTVTIVPSLIPLATSAAA